MSGGFRLRGAQADQSVLPRHASDLLREGGWMPTGAIAQTIPDRQGAANLTQTSGTLYLAGGCVIPGGRTVSSITFLAAAASITPTNQWFCIVDQSLNVLATTVDDLTTAWAANAVKPLLLATTLGGGTPGGTYTPASAIEVYLGVCQVAATPATTRGILGTSQQFGLAPIITASSSTGLTTPASLGATAGARTALTFLPYAYCS